MADGPGPVHQHTQLLVSFILKAQHLDLFLQLGILVETVHQGDDDPVNTDDAKRDQAEAHESKREGPSLEHGLEILRIRPGDQEREEHRQQRQPLPDVIQARIGYHVGKAVPGQQQEDQHEEQLEAQDDTAWLRQNLRDPLDACNAARNEACIQAAERSKEQRVDGKEEFLKETSLYYNKIKDQEDDGKSVIEVFDRQAFVSRPSESTRKDRGAEDQIQENNVKYALPLVIAHKGSEGDPGSRDHDQEIQEVTPEKDLIDDHYLAPPSTLEIIYLVYRDRTCDRSRTRIG